MSVRGKERVLLMDSNLKPMKVLPTEIELEYA